MAKQQMTIAQLEDELRQSQFLEWDAEAFLADIHRTKIEKIEPLNAPVWPAIKELVATVAFRLWLFGAAIFLAILAGKAVGLWAGLS